MEGPLEASIHHGKKRHGDEDLIHEQRLAKRFNLLNLGISLICSLQSWLTHAPENNSKLYLPVQQAAPEHLAYTNGDDGSMQLDDTKDKVYVYNLDQELADIETEEERLVFLPDIEKKLGKIPKSLLIGHSQPAANTQMVLYNVPSSLTVTPEKDNVRRAIIETRARAREKQTGDARASEATHNNISEMANGVQPNHCGHELSGIRHMEDYEIDEEDAMDIG